MIVFRLTSSLAKKMSLRLSEPQAESTSQLGDWYATDFRLGPRKFILCTSQNGRFPLVIEAAPYKKFPDRLVRELKISLNELGVSQAIVETEISNFDKLQFAKTIDRSVVGTMVDSIKNLGFMNDIGQINPDDRKWMNNYLARTPHVKLNSYPTEMTLKLLQ